MAQVVAHLSVKIDNEGSGLVPSKERGKHRTVKRNHKDYLSSVPMKRVNHLYEKLISDENLALAIDEVNSTHHWMKDHKPNKCTAWVEVTKEDRIKDLRKFIVEGFEPHRPRTIDRYDAAARKWRTVNEPLQWPDQYIHHALIQVLQPVMMRGMDYYCCGSIKERGTSRARIAIQDWIGHDVKGTKYCMCLDIYHFYDTINPNVVMDRMRQLIKDHRVLDLIWRIVKDGLKIGFYTSQWFANTLLQPLDMLIRKSGLCKRYVRYMDNLTIFGPNKRKLFRLKLTIENWLAGHLLKLKHDWQIYPVAKNEPKEALPAPRRGVTRAKGRLPCAVGYRYGRTYTIPRKHNVKRLKRQITKFLDMKKRHRPISGKLANGILSRLGQLKHCNNHNLYAYLYDGKRVVRQLKKIVREEQGKEGLEWTTYLEQTAITKYSKPKAQNTAA